MTMLDDVQRPALLAEMKADTPDLTKDYLRDIFQKEHGDRDKLKQDYTPDGLCQLLGRLVSQGAITADICAGTGALSIGVGGRSNLYCEEYSSRAIPFLLCNLALRNRRAVVVEGNSLTGEIKNCYELEAGTEFSSINILPNTKQVKADNVIMNPPYSMKWEPIEHPQYTSYGKMPKTADFPFVLHGLSLLKEGGTLLAILPHGPLFRGQKEGDIRRELLKRNVIDAVIGIPEKLFMNTGIPVVILVLKNKRQRNDVLFIDATKDFTKQGKINILEPTHIDKIAAAYKSRGEIKKFSHVATMGEIEKNDFNLNIPRYVDTFEEEETEPLDQCLCDLADIEKEIHNSELAFGKMINQLVGTTEQAQHELSSALRVYKQHIMDKYGGRQMPVQKSLF